MSVITKDNHEPQGIPVLPLRDVVVFPGMVIPLFVGREKSINAVDWLPPTKIESRSQFRLIVIVYNLIILSVVSFLVPTLNVGTRTKC